MILEENILDFDAFLRSFQLINQQGIAVLLGAGCSISSGVYSASKCIWDWKRLLYQTKNPELKFVSIDSDNDRREIQRWCDLQPGYPQQDSPEEYSFYVEKVYPHEQDRINYFENLFEGKEPSIGYKLLVSMFQQGALHSIWTTNFDDLALKAASYLNIKTFPIAIENQQTIYNSLMRKGLKYISLHGDYRFSKLKNTEEELYSQESHFVSSMTSHLAEKHLIVLGYSGRDKSLMKALNYVYSQRGGGRLFWLGLDESPSQQISSLIEKANASGRIAVYVKAPVFDESLYQIYRHAFGETNLFNDIIQSHSNPNIIPNIIPFNNKITGDLIQVGSTNLLPVMVPQTCYAFSIKQDETNPFKNTLKSKIGNRFIAATFYGGKIYAFGSIKDILEAFGPDIIDSPILINIPYSTYSEKPFLKRLALKAILLGIARRAQLNLNFKGLLWNKEWTIDNSQNLYEAVKISLRWIKGKNYMLMGISPTIYIEDEGLYAKSIKQKKSREYIDKLRNSNYFKSLSKWIHRIFNGVSHIDFNFSEIDDLFKFAISSNTAFYEILDGGDSLQNKNEKQNKRVLYIGKRIPEPKLIFSTLDKNYIPDANPMKGLQENQPFDLPTFVLDPLKVSLGVICPVSYRESLYNFLAKLSSGNIGPRYADYLQTFPGFSKAYKTELNIPFYHQSSMWVSCKDIQTDGLTLARNICLYLDKISDIKPKAVIIIFIPKQWKNLRTFKIQNIEMDFHDYIKSHCAQKGITTQFIEEKTINDKSMECEIMWWLSLAIFVKSGRTPWTLGSLNQNTAYAGIGYSLKNINDKNSIVIGCSHLYNSHGEGLKFRLRKIDNPIFDKKKNPYLSRDEAYKLGLNIVSLFRDSMSKAPERVVIHKRTEFKKEEIEGLSDALLPHIKDLELITIEFESDLKLIPLSLDNRLIADGYPIKRGTYIPISINKFLLWTHGSIESVKKGRLYYQGGKGIPKPLRITRYLGTSSLEEVASDILSFTKINWNTFNFYSQLPATIETSNTVARIGRFLQHYNGNTFDYKYFI